MMCDREKLNPNIHFPWDTYEAALAELGTAAEEWDRRCKEPYAVDAQARYHVALLKVRRHPDHAARIKQ